VLTQQQLYDAIDETPGIAVNVIRLLSRRIRELNQDLNQVKQQLVQPSPPFPRLDRSGIGPCPFRPPNHWPVLAVRPTDNTSFLTL
jgi:hypothetical protein